jgi:hypothetical protein
MENKLQNEEKAKKEYSTPNLIVHGEVRVLTQSGTQGLSENFGNKGFERKL